MSSSRAKRSNQPSGASGGTRPQWRCRARRARIEAAQYNRIDFRSRRFFGAVRRCGAFAGSSNEALHHPVEPAAAGGYAVRSLRQDSARTGKLH
jgi:hypothetical protein